MPVMRAVPLRWSQFFKPHPHKHTQRWRHLHALTLLPTCLPLHLIMCSRRWIHTYPAYKNCHTHTHTHTITTLLCMSTNIHTYGVTMVAHSQVSSGSSEHVHMGSLGQRHVNVHSLMSTFHTLWYPVKTNIHSYMGSSTALCVHMYLKQDFCLTFSHLSGKWWWRTESLCKAEISYLNAKCSPGLWLPLVTDGDRNGHKICMTTSAILADPWDPAWDWYVGLRLRARASITWGVF